MKRFLIALQFLTIIPVKGDVRDNADIGASLLYFPLIGLLIGLILSMSALLFSSLPPLARAAMLLMISIIITGAIHLDGLADTCDGFCGGAGSRERTLEIMRDSHIGAMGAVGVVSILLIKFSLVASLPTPLVWKAMLLMPVFSRWSQTIVCRMGPYARKEGKARYFVEHSRQRDVLIGGIFTIALFLSLVSFKGILIFFLSLLPVLLFSSHAKAKIGGQTGDTIGAANEIAEVSMLVFFLIFEMVWV